MKEKYLNQVKQFHSKFNRLPSYREMVEMWGLASKNSATRLVKEWISVGLLEKQGKIISPTSEFFAIPVLGIIRAGYPDTPAEATVEKVNLNDFLVKNPSSVFLLKVQGDSMIDAGIFEGDMALVDKSKLPIRGDIVAACIDGEWTLKYFEKTNGSTYLRAGNGKYINLYPRESLTIGGVIVGVVRKYH